MPANRKNKPVLLNLDGLLLKEVKFDKFKFIADQIMLVSGGRLYAVATTEPRCTQFALILAKALAKFIAKAIS